MDVMPKGCIDVPRARFALEPLIKGYLRQGAWVGDSAYVDHAFNSVDVCIVMPTAHLTHRLRRHYERELLHSPMQETPLKVPTACQPRHAMRSG